MNVSHPEKSMRQSCALKDITTPAEIAAVLRTCYPEPLAEVSRRAATDAAEGLGNWTFWSRVKNLMLAETGDARMGYLNGMPEWDA